MIRPPWKTHVGSRLLIFGLINSFTPEEREPVFELLWDCVAKLCTRHMCKKVQDHTVKTDWLRSNFVLDSSNLKWPFTWLSSKQFTFAVWSCTFLHMCVHKFTIQSYSNSKTGSRSSRVKPLYQIFLPSRSHFLRFSAWYGDKNTSTRAQVKSVSRSVVITYSGRYIWWMFTKERNCIYLWQNYMLLRKTLSKMTLPCTINQNIE